MDDPRLVVDGAIALGLGLMIGLEREHHDIDVAQRRPVLGVRSFALLALLGWASGAIAAATGTPWLPAAVLIAVAALNLGSFFSVPEAGTGLTSEIASLMTVAIGLLVRLDRGAAAAAAVVTTLLLLSKPWFGKLVPRLRRVDFTAALQMAIALAVVLPMLPAEASDPWHVLSPRRIGLFVTLIMGVDFVGYVLHRTIGQRRGAGLTGLLGGLTSSTAVTAAMAQQARAAPSMVAVGQMATFIANAVMAVRVVVIAAVVNRQVALALAPAMGAAALVLLGGAAWKWRVSRKEKHGDAALEVRNPLALTAALKWGLFLSFVLVAAAVGKQLLGERGVIAAAVLSGLADVDAITLAVTRQAGAGELARAVAVLAIVVAAASNTVVKAGIALVSGGRRFGRDVALVFGLALAAGLAVALAAPALS